MATVGKTKNHYERGFDGFSIKPSKMPYVRSPFVCESIVQLPIRKQNSTAPARDKEGDPHRAIEPACSRPRLSLRCQIPDVYLVDWTPRKSI
jgi:hypothetical protein